MTTDQLVVDFNAMHQAAADIQSAINKLTSDLDQLNQDAQPLVQTWSGPAQAAYHQRQQIWTNAANDLAQMLRDIQKALVESTADYNATENRNRDLFQ
ncbi:MAG: WXG100 family type VII secretion target [Micromonosporaceae bacterium]|jgi:WXG100 family type VII secretion target|nr:WXG100 family type VII secretion target [Micromonosporaceae bacterium]